MEVGKIKIIDPNGFHMRNAANVVSTAIKFKSKIYFCHKCKFADSCSILQLLTLEATTGADIAVIAEGPDEKDAIRSITGVFENGAGI